MASAAKAKAAAKAAHAKKAGAPPASASQDKKPAVSNDRFILPPKDQTLFKQILVQYEQKQHHKGLKNCEALLKKYPDHGESLAMQGLFHHCLHDKELGYELVKKGVRHDLRSHIVWHVYGIITRADRNYDEALKCYTQAHKMDPDNINILRDLALLQVQLRHYSSYVQSRHLLLGNGYKTRQTWIGLAVAYHLNFQHDASLDILLALENMQAEAPPQSYDLSESILFSAIVGRAAGRDEWALTYLDERRNLVLDTKLYSVTRAEILTSLGRRESAEWEWTSLLDDNSENRSYIQGYLKAKGCSSEGQDVNALNVIQGLCSRYPRSNVLRRMVLDFSSGEAFRQSADSYMRAGLIKGIPSLFVDLKSICLDKEKGPVLGSLVEAYQTLLESGKNLGDDDSLDGETTSAYLWTLYFLVHYYSSQGQQERALSTLEVALEHTPTLPELLMTKARLLKRCGAPLQAAKAMAEARDLDGQDRFLNCKAAKYCLRAGHVDEARALVKLFVRKDAPGPVEDLVDMQALWFMIEEAECARRKGEVALALKRYHQVGDTYSQWVEDQCDFHTYCFRKTTLLAYLDLLNYEDGLYDNPNIIHASEGAIGIYLDLYDKSQEVSIRSNGVNGNENEIEGPIEEATSIEKNELSKKAQKKAKMAEAKAKANVAAEAKKAAQSSQKDADAIVAKDDDPTGVKLISTTDPLTEAEKWLKPLRAMAQKRPETWYLSAEVAIRKGLPLLALSYLRQAYAIAPNHSRVHVAFAGLLHHDISPHAEEVKEAFKRSLGLIFPFKDIHAANVAYTSSDVTSATRLIASAEALMRSKGDASTVEDILFRVLSLEHSRSEDGARCSRLLSQIQSAREEEFRDAASSRWKLAEAFWTREMLEASATRGNSDTAVEEIHDT